jgi:hypothetical protein
MSLRLNPYSPGLLTGAVPFPRLIRYIFCPIPIIQVLVTPRLARVTQDIIPCDPRRKGPKGSPSGALPYPGFVRQSFRNLARSPCRLVIPILQVLVIPRLVTQHLLPCDPRCKGPKGSPPGALPCPGFMRQIFINISRSPCRLVILILQVLITPQPVAQHVLGWTLAAVPAILRVNCPRSIS